MRSGLNEVPEAPQVLIVILNWNGRELLRSCLKSLEKTAFKSYRVIVVDNGSTDGSQHMVGELFLGVHLVENPRNYGFARGMNVGIVRGCEIYHPNYFVIMNNDVEVIDSNWLTEIVVLAESDERIAVVGPKVLRPESKIDFAFGTSFPGIRNIAQAETDRGQYDFRTEADIVTGACFLVRRTALERAGAYDEAFGVGGYEDIDLFLRMKRAGFKITYSGHAKVLHHVSSSWSKFVPSQRMYSGLRNYFRCIRLNFGLAFLGLRAVLTELHVVRKRKQVSPGQLVRALAASFEPRRIPKLTSPCLPCCIDAPDGLTLEDTRPPQGADGL
ncbi:MAG: glycosyltransferase family 2 protein [Nitrososphaeria archaeon]